MLTFSMPGNGYVEQGIVIRGCGLVGGQAVQQPTQDFLWHFASASLQVGEARQPERRVQSVRRRFKRPAQGEGGNRRSARSADLQLDGGEGVARGVCHRGAGPRLGCHQLRCRAAHHISRGAQARLSSTVTKSAKRFDRVGNSKTFTAPTRFSRGNFTGQFRANNAP